MQEGFMKQQVFKDTYFEINTTCGTEVVPSDVCGRTMSTHVEFFLNYLEGTPDDPDELVEAQEGWVGRMSAPGYQDCTSWISGATEDEVREQLDDLFGD